MPEQDSFGNRLITARRARGWSQGDLVQQLAGAAKQSTISDYELNKTEPSLEMLRLLARVLDRSCDWLLGLKDYTGDLPAGYWLVDLDFVESLRRGQPPPITMGDFGAVAIPPRCVIMPPLRYQALRDELAPMLGARPRKGKRT